MNDQRNARAQQDLEDCREQDKPQCGEEGLMGNRILEKLLVIAESDKRSLQAGKGDIQAVQAQYKRVHRRIQRKDSDACQRGQDHDPAGCLI